MGEALAISIPSLPMRISCLIRRFAAMYELFVFFHILKLWETIANKRLRSGQEAYGQAALARV
jgi:predicted component of viral defense system (DUF524 family)